MQLRKERFRFNMLHHDNFAPKAVAISGFLTAFAGFYHNTIGNSLIGLFYFSLVCA
ncbi:MAG TPA: hypothetical protein VG842_02120 [Sediminibacterium sp.]|nr:hypothetical protein [Sediminibacterium sp.]